MLDTDHQRRRHLVEFYSMLDRLEEAIGGARTLAACSGRLGWPAKGVYFFREPGETRTDTGEGPRIVRVGTHGLKVGARAKLWARLSQHKGQPTTGGGNHRGSIFRLIVGVALMQRHGQDFPTWGDKSSAPRAVRGCEQALECEVSRFVGAMPFLWLAIDDEAGPQSLRGYIERNAIALLSNYGKTPLDRPSGTWLGLDCDRERVRTAGVWNSNHVDEDYDPAFLRELDRLVAAMERRS